MSLFWRLVALGVLFETSLGYSHFRGAVPQPISLVELSHLSPAAAIPVIAASSNVPAPSAVNTQVSSQAVSVASQNKAVCGQPAVGQTTTATGSLATASTTSGACVVGATSTPDGDNSTGQYVAMALGGLVGLITIAAIVQKYKTMGSYSSFWGRMIGLLGGAAGAGYGYSNFSAYQVNECSNFFGDSSITSPCPCLGCCYVLFAFGAVQLLLNLPFLYASEKSIAKMYASYGLFTQGTIMFSVSGAAVGGVKFMDGDMMSMAISASGCLVAALFILGWMKGEDGIFSRMFQGAKDMLNDASAAAVALVDDGLKVFGLNADERSKVTLSNVYNFSRVVRGPDWSAGDEDGGPDAPGGEIIGYVGENGLAEGVPVTARSAGWAKVKWDNGKSGEYRIGAGNKFELKMVEETDGIVDKLMGQTFALFGFDPNANKSPPKEKKQIEFILTSRLPGETEPETEGALDNDNADSDGDSPKKAAAAAKGSAGARGSVGGTSGSPDSLVMTCDVFDRFGKSLGRCDDGKPMLFKSAVRHRQLGAKQDAIVVELQKLPDSVAVIALSAIVPEGNKLGHWGMMNIRSTSTGHDLSKLSVSAAEGTQAIQKHMGSQGYLWMTLYRDETGAWFVERSSLSLGSGSPMDVLVEKVGKFLRDRESKKKSDEKGKKKAAAAAVVVKDELVSVDQIFENLKIELRCEQQARELMNVKMNAVTSAFSARFRQQGVPAAQADLQAKKLALIQINKQHQLLYQKTLIVRRAQYLRQRMHPVHAMILAKKDANRAALYDGKEAEIRKAVINTINEEKEAEEQHKREEQAQYGDTYTGQAEAVLGSVWSWATAPAAPTEETEGKKKKKKHKKGEAGEEEPVAAAPAAAAPVGLPPQFANLSPQQIAALRAMQQRQQQAAAPNSKVMLVCNGDVCEIRGPRVTKYQTKFLEQTIALGVLRIGGVIHVRTF